MAILNLTPTPSILKEEVLRGMIKTMDLGTDVALLNVVRNTLNTMWEFFDDDGSGDIDMEEFVKKDGLADLIVVQMDMLKQEKEKAKHFGLSAFAMDVKRAKQEDAKKEKEKEKKDVVVDLKMTFEKYDTNGSGKIGPKKLERLLRDLDFEVDDVILSDILRRIDTNNDGEVDLREMIGWWQEAQDLMDHGERKQNKIKSNVMAGPIAMHVRMY